VPIDVDLVLAEAHHVAIVHFQFYLAAHVTLLKSSTSTSAKLKRISRGGAILGSQQLAVQRGEHVSE
jgi:hypothetical protein